MKSINKIKLAAILFFILGLAGSQAVLADEVIYDNSGFTINGVSQGNLLNPPPYLLGGNNTVWAGPGGSVTDNQVTVDYTAAPYGDPLHVLGGFSDGASVVVSGNQVVMKNGDVRLLIFGGFSVSGDAANNSVSMEGGQTDTIYGGYSREGNATGNSVTIQGDTTSNNVFGGYSMVGNATGNTVTMRGGTVGGDINAGYSMEGDVSNNTVNMEDGTVESEVRAGYSELGAATSNTVNMNNGAADYVFGGYSEQGAATGNTVTMRGGTVVNDINAGRSEQNDANNNTVNMEGGTVTLDIFGGYSEQGNAAGNTVNMRGGTVGDEIYGGYSEQGNATGNTLIIENGTVGSTIIGGCSGSGNADTNTVVLENGTFNGNIYGGYVTGGNATGNTVTINSGALGPDSGVMGGYDVGSGGDNDVFSGNTLNLSTPISVAQVGNFENYNFYLPSTIKNNDAMITVHGYSQEYLNDMGVSNENTDINNSRISVDIAGSAPTLHTGDIIHLIKVDNPGYQLVGTPASFTAQQGLTMVYQVENLQDDNSYYLRILSRQPAIQTRAYAEGYAAGAAFINQGADLLASQGMSAMRKAIALADSDQAVVWGTAMGGKSGYDTGLSTHVRGLSLIVGAAKNTSFNAGDLLLGAFVEGGFGSYNSNNSFSNAASVYADGDTRYLGGGVLGRFGFNNGFYSEAALRLGHTETDFVADNINGHYATYDSSGMYVGAQFGLGYVFKLSQAADLDIYAKYLFTWIDGDTVQLNSGEEVEFDDVYSQRGRVGARLSYAIPQLTPYVGAAYDYEFDGNIGARVRGMAIDEPSLRGGSGIFEIGFNWQPVEGGHWSFDLGLEGYVGTREGLGGGFRVNYMF